MPSRMWTILYVVALLATGVFTFGVLGFIPFLCVLSFWAWIFSSHKLNPALNYLIVVAIAVVLFSMLLPTMPSARDFSRQLACLNNLRQISLALNHHASTHGSFPPATSSDEHGNLLHSWRTEILPSIERKDLYDAIDQKIAWDAPENRAATSTSIPLFMCPNDLESISGAMTSYFAVVGPHTAWPEGRGRPLSEFTDSKSQTILLIEAGNRGVPWAKPSDLTFDEAVQILTGDAASAMHPDAPYRGFFDRAVVKAVPGINVGMADGTVHFLARSLPKELAVALLTVDGGERDLESQLEPYTRPQLDQAKVYGMSIFVLLSLSPIVLLPRLIARQRSYAKSQP